MSEILTSVFMQVGAGLISQSYSQAQTAPAAEGQVVAEMKPVQLRMYVTSPTKALVAEFSFIAT